MYLLQAEILNLLASGFFYTYAAKNYGGPQKAFVYIGYIYFDIIWTLSKLIFTLLGTKIEEFKNIH